MTLDLGLSGRTAIVTGAAQGIGLAIAQNLHHHGCNVLLGDVQKTPRESEARGIDWSGERALAVELDVRDENSFEAALETALTRWGSVDILINNAARTSETPIWDIQDDEWNDVLDVNVRGVFYGCRAAGSEMRRRGRGRIVNLASLAGQWGRSITGAHYSASKAAIVALTRRFAMELASSNVTVNAVAPAAIDTPAVRTMPPERVAAYVESTIPVGRLGRPEEVADLVAFLASDLSGFITGATIDINGGALMR